MHKNKAMKPKVAPLTKTNPWEMEWRMPLLRHTRFTGPGVMDATKAKTDMGRMIDRLTDRIPVFWLRLESAGLRSVRY